MAKGKRANIYTDSKYAFLITHCHSALWKERGFLTIKGTPIVNATHISNLLQALLLPKEFAVIHCRGHRTQQDPISRGNARADAVAKALTSTRPAPAPVLFLTTATLPVYSPSERQDLMLRGGTKSDRGWIFLNNNIALPREQAPKIIAEIHQSLHIGPKALHLFVQPLFYSPGLQQTIEQVHKTCVTCSKVSSQGSLRLQFPTHQMRGNLPAQDWQIDFTHMPTHKKLRYLLTFVDTFSGWIEAFPTSRETADTVASILIQEIIPRFGLPATIQSDNGPAFIAQESWKQGPTTRTQYSATSSYARSWTCPTLQSRCQPTDLSPLLRPYSAGSSQKEQRPLSIIKRSECKVGCLMESSDTPPPLAGSLDTPPSLAGSSDTPLPCREPGEKRPIRTYLIPSRPHSLSIRGPTPLHFVPPTLATVQSECLHSL
nr:protein NYNRIN-like [Aotus nancymaae]